MALFTARFGEILDDCDLHLVRAGTVQPLHSKILSRWPVVQGAPGISPG